MNTPTHTVDTYIQRMREWNYSWMYCMNYGFVLIMNIYYDK